MALTDWIDQIPKRWETITDHTGGSLRAYHLYDKVEFPESVEPPCVITYPTGVGLTYSVGGPIFAHWVGRSDFFLFDNVSKANIPQMCRYFEKIMIAALGTLTLSSTVVNFSIDSEYVQAQSIEGFLSMTYGNNDNPMHGMTVNWFVKDDISNDTGISVAA